VDVCCRSGVEGKITCCPPCGLQKNSALPKDNERDLKDIPDSVKEDVEFVPVAHMDQVLQHALVEQTILK
jgi:ATP-dependent Lon protease